MNPIFSSKQFCKKAACPLFLLWCQILWPAPASGETLAQQHNLKGVSYLRDRSMEEAKKEFMLAIKANTKYAPAHNNLGFTLYQEAVAKPDKDGNQPAQTNPQKETSPKALEVDDSRRLQPAHPNERRINPATTSTLVKEALYHLEAALKYAARPDIIRQVRENLALLYTDTRIGLPVRQEDWHKKGVKIYESLIREEPNNPEYHMRLGFACFNVANPGGGFGELEKASQLAKDKDTLWIHKELQRFYSHINFAAQAVREQELIGTLERRQEGSK